MSTKPKIKPGKGWAWYYPDTKKLGKVWKDGEQLRWEEVISVTILPTSEYRRLKRIEKDHDIYLKRLAKEMLK